jgi:hypothetical protein
MPSGDWAMIEWTSEKQRRAYLAMVWIAEKSKHKNNRQYDHEEYFMTDEEYRLHQFCERNKKQIQVIANGMMAIFAAMPTAQEVADTWMNAACAGMSVDDLEE